MFTRRGTSDSAIGWISTVDSLLLGFGLMVVLALHSAMTQQNAQVAAKADKKELGEAKEDLKALQYQMLQGKKQVDVMKELLAESDMNLMKLTADLMAVSKKRDELYEQSQRLKEQLDAEAQGAEGINQQFAEAIRERDSLRKQQAESDRRLAIARSEIEGVKKQLADTAATATTTQEERNTLEGRVNEMQAMVLTLRDRQQQTAMRSDELEEEANRLKETIDDKAREMKSLREDLAAKERELSKLKANHSEAESLLKKANADMSQLKSHLDESNRKLTVSQKERAAAEQNQQALKAEKGELQKKMAEAQAATQRGKQIQEQLDAKSEELVRLRNKLMASEGAKQLAEDKLRNEKNAEMQAAASDVLGFNGQFKNVVFIIDISESMLQSGDPILPGVGGNAAARQRWNKTKREIVSWARHLPMETLRLVVFNSKVYEYPGDGKFFSMESADRAEAVRVLERGLGNVVPRTQTNTLAAFRKAYSYPGVDTIILFTDGQPYVQGIDEAVLIADVQRLIGEHRDIPVNVVGIGEYFEKSFADFLRGIASTTGGEFIGR